MESASAIVPLVLEYSIGPIVRHASYPFNYKSKVTSLEDGVKELKSARDGRKLWVDEHERNGKEISQDVLKWLKDVDEFIEKEEAEVDLASEETKKKCCLGFCPNLKTRYRVSKKAEQKAGVAADFSEKNGTFSTDQHVHTPPLQCVEGFSSKDFEEFESRMSILGDIMKALRSVDVNTIGVYGTGGVGKTTLAREVGRKAREEKLFDEVIMVTVTTDVDVINIQNTIADFLGLKFNEESKEGRAARLCERLMKKEKKTLVILDDLWKKLKLEEVGIPQPGEHNGCKLLLTSRNSNVLSNEMGSQNDFPINTLAEDEAWGLFQKISGSSFDDPVAKDVVKLCFCLPIAIVTVASSLKGKDTYEWRNALTTLKTTPPADLPEILAEVYWSIQLSYSKLDTEELRSTFLLCCQLGYNASIRDLLNYCIGLGLLDVDKVEDAQCRVYSLVQQLKRRCLLLEGHFNGQLVMHDLVRDVGRWIAYHDHGVVVVADDRNNSKDWADEEKIKTYKRIWLYKNAVKLQEELQCPDLVFLHMDGKGGNLQLPHNLHKLKVLSLTGFNVSSLPSSVGLLKSLKMLSFYQSSQLGDDVRIVGELKMLEVLSFAESSIRHLVKEIGQLTNLKLLDLTDCKELEVIPSNVLSKLSRLEELYMANSFNRWGIERDNASLTELTQLHSLSNLEIVIQDANLIPEGLFSEKKLCRYRIFIGGERWDYRGKEDIVKTLKMKLGADDNMPNGVLELLKETQELYLDGVENILCDSPLAGMQSFRKLRYVTVKGCNKLTHLFSFTVAQGLSQLQEIKVSSCRSMEEIVSEENKREATTMEEIVFLQLLRLELVGLPKLKRFCKGYLLECPLLKELYIEDCPDLKTFITRDQNEDMRLAGTPPALFDDRVSFPSLVEMRMEYLDSMESIWDNQLASGSFGELRTLTIWGCHKLRKVFPSAQHGRFQKLEVLSVHSSKLVEEIFEDEEGGSNNHAISFQLRNLQLSGLPKLKNVFPYSIASNLLKLERIDISGRGLEEIVAAAKAEMNGETSVCFEFPELTSLTFQGVPGLRRWYPGMHTLRLPKLKHLKITIDIQMPLLFPREVICNLQELVLYRGSNSDSKPWHYDFPANLFSTLKLLQLHDLGGWEGIPVSILQEFHNLEKLTLQTCAFEELFFFDGDDAAVAYNSAERQLPRLKHLELCRLKDMRYLCGGQQNHTFDLSPLFPSLETLKVDLCGSLVSVVAPSSSTVSFQNLTSLIVWSCHKLVNIVTTTTAKSLSNLVTLKVRDCPWLTEIVSEGEDDGDDEITFTKLQNLTLTYLPSLTSFCSGNYGFSFPCLNEVSVKGCPRMKLFSRGQVLNTPKLPNVYFKRSLLENEVCWEGNLNATIRQLHNEMVGFEGLRSLKLSEFRELRKKWHAQLHLESFSQLLFLEVDGSSNFSTAVPFNRMLYLNSLWQLSVSKCDSLEGVFDLENHDALHDALLPGLGELRLSDLPRLHHIFPSHPPSNFDFNNLVSLKLGNCSSLTNVLTTSMALCLVDLETIEIINCIALEEIITQEENAGGSVAKFIFPRLKVVVLESLPNLISFNSGSGILEFSSLESITVDRCPNMKPFISSFLREQLSKVAVDEIHLVATTSLVDDDDKVAYPNLTELEMDWNDAMEEIGRGEFEAKFFRQLRTLAIINLHHHHLTFPSHFLLRFHNVENLALENAMFEEITVHEATNGEDTSVGSLEKLRNLILSNLPRLVHLTGEGSPLCSIFQNLEVLQVLECGILDTLVPSTISFQSLTTLQVSKCHKLLSLMTCTAAKSLKLLTGMCITECPMLEQIVGNEENVAGSEVTLAKLECLELHCLPNLLGFSLWNCAFTFPSLKDVVVRECSKMKIFSQGVVTAPNLRRVIQTEGKEKWCWKGSLNATIQKLHEDQAMLPNRSNLDVDAGQLLRNGKSHMSDGTGSGDFCEIKNPSVKKNHSPNTTTTKHNEDDEEDRTQDPSSSTPMDIRSRMPQAQMDDFSTDQNKTIPPSSTEQSVHGDATATPISHNQQGVSSPDKERLHKRQKRSN